MDVITRTEKETHKRYPTVYVDTHAHHMHVHLCTYTARTHAHTHTYTPGNTGNLGRTTLVNVQHSPPAVTAETRQRKEHKNLSQDTTTRLCSLLPWRLNPKLVLLNEVSSTGIIKTRHPTLVPACAHSHQSVPTPAKQPSFSHLQKDSKSQSQHPLSHGWRKRG